MFMPKIRVESINELYKYNEAENTIAEVVTERDSNGNPIRTECYTYRNNSWMKIEVLNG